MEEFCFCECKYNTISINSKQKIYFFYQKTKVEKLYFKIHIDNESIKLFVLPTYKNHFRYPNNLDRKQSNKPFVFLLYKYW